MKPEYTEKSLKKARRYLKQFHRKEWDKIDHNDSGYAIILTAIDCYNKGKKR